MKNIVTESLAAVGYIPMGEIISALKKKELKIINPMSGFSDLPYNSDTFKHMDINLTGFVLQAFLKYGPPSGLRAVVNAFEPKANSNLAVANILSNFISNQVNR